MDDRKLTETTVRILSGSAPEEIARLLTDALKATTGHRTAAVFLHDGGTLVPALPDTVPGLKPPDELLETVWSEDEHLTIPLGSFGPVTLFPLRTRGERVAVAALAWPARPVTPEELRSSRFLADHAAMALHTARILRGRADQYALLNNVLDSISNGIVTLDLQSRVTLLNRNACTFLETGTASVGRPAAEVFPPAMVEAVDAMMAELLAGRFPMERQVVLRLSGGAELPVALSLAPLRDAAWIETGSIVVLRDMTAGRELERLRRIDEMKSRFVASVSHELKTPLTSIKAYTEAVMDMATAEPMKKFLRVIDEEADRLLHLINDLLSTATIQSGELRLTLAPATLRDVVDDVLKIWRPPPTHPLEDALPADLPATLLDRPKMKEVVLNLLTNAVKYSPKGGPIRIHGRRQEDALRLEVRDAGIGISREAQASLFQPFFRADDSLTAEIGGTGLGLSIAKAIVDRHGGRIGVDSEPGRGSTFFVLLPIRSGPAA